MVAPRNASRLMVVDDELSMREFLEIALIKSGYQVEVASDPRAVLARMEQVRFDAVISDIRMPGMTGLELMRQARRVDPDMGFVLITAYAETDQAVEAMKAGADDYVSKPFKLDELKVVIESVLARRLLQAENTELRRELQTHRREYTGLMGNSEPMRRLKEMIDRVAASRTNVLVTGESGVGKELVARAVHLNSDRRNRSFVAVNCGAIPRELMESEFFGHMRGAFTGAVANKPGFFEAASGGTLFLDEIGELPPDLQVKLLRAIQEGEVQRVGASEPIQVDVRLIAATNRDLERMVGEGSFREDLYYRLNVISLPVPPLRERMDDIPMLAAHFLEKHNARQGRRLGGIDPDALEAMGRYAWPGNVRELENTIERCVALSSGESLHRDLLPPSMLQPGISPAGVSGAPHSIPLPLMGRNLDDVVNDYERALIERALTLAGGKRREASRLLGLSDRTFRYKVIKFGIDPKAMKD